MFSTTILLTLVGFQGILASPLPPSLPTDETLPAPTILKNPLGPSTAEIPTIERRMADCPGLGTIGISTPLGKGVKCPTAADVQSLVPVAAPGRMKREARPQLDALPLSTITDLVGGAGNLPVKEKRQLDALPLGTVTDLVGGAGNLPVKEKRQLDALPLSTVTDLVGGAGNLPVKEKRQVDALPLDTIADAFPVGLPAKMKRQFEALTQLLGGGQKKNDTATSSLPLKEKRQLEALTGLLGSKKNGTAGLPFKG